MRDLVEDTSELQPGGLPASWLSPVNNSHDLKSSPDPFDIALSPEYLQSYRSLAGSPFESSDSDSSDCDDDALSVASLNLSSTGRESPFGKDDISLIDWEGIETTNALGLVFTFGEDVDEAKAATTFSPQAESLQAPRYHQDARSCGRPDQNYHALQERLAFQSDGPTDETLVRRFPQDIGLPGDVSDSSAPKIFQGLNGSYAGTFGPYKVDDDLKDGLDDCQLLRAPRKRYIPLPEVEEQEDGEELFYGGSDMGGWLTGALDGVPKTMLLGDCLDVGLPVPFAMVD